MKELCFLSWNIQNKNVIAPLKELLSAIKPDVLLLNESIIDDSEISGFVRVGTHHQKAKLYTAKPECLLSKYNDTASKHINFAQIGVAYHKILVAGLHLPSKLYKDRDTQAYDAADYMQIIKEQMKLMNSKECIIFGDFNMNPFDLGMMNTKGFHSVSCAELSKKPIKKNNKSYIRFYNPMFGLLGDFIPNNGNHKAAGNYFTNSLKSINDFNWNILDNVLLGGKAVDWLDKSSVKFVEQSNSHIFYSKPNSINYSDHLPLTFKLQIP